MCTRLHGTVCTARKHGTQARHASTGAHGTQARH
eukprot:SAG11_NODE_12413_length_705_cov_0.762376_1_plen_33_part_01